MIAGSGRFVPGRRVSSDMMDMACGLAPGFLAATTGVDSRFVCGSESQIDMAVAASRIALAEAADAGPPDLILCGSAVPYQPIPATAPLVMGRLGLADGTAAAFDVNSTCLSFLTAFETASRMITLGQARTALVVSSEIASRALPWQSQPEVAALFGDGAGAVVLTGTKDGTKDGTSHGSGGLRASLMRSYPSAYDACTLGSGGTRFDYWQDPKGFARHATFSMDGKELFRLASRHFAGFVSDLLARAGWRRDEVDLVVPHQASPAALAHMIRQSGLAADRVVDITRDHGNQIAASIPVAFDIARKAGRAGPGRKVLFLGTSAGVSFGGLAVET